MTFFGNNGLSLMDKFQFQSKSSIRNVPLDKIFQIHKISRMLYIRTGSTGYEPIAYPVNPVNPVKKIERIKGYRS